MPAVLFNASTPAVRQGFSWDCAAASLAWLLSSAGVPTTEAAAISILGPNVNPSVGLTDASGSGVVASLAAQGIAATNGGLGFDDAKGLAGSVPLMIGGAAFNHWTGVSGVDGDSLVLANPAPGWMGVGDRMSRAQFGALGPFSGVWLTGVAVGAGGPTIAGVQLNPWMLLGAAVAVLLLVDGEDILPNPARKQSGGFDAWQPDLFGGRGKERGEGKTRAQQMGFAREEMRDTGSPSLFESLFGGSPPRRRRRVRRNIDAFYGAHGVLHPIRGSEGYDPEVEQMQGEAKVEREQADKYRRLGVTRAAERETGIVRPDAPWARGVSLANLVAIAKEAGVSPYRHGWWDTAGLSAASSKRETFAGGRVVTVSGGPRRKASGEYQALIAEGAHRGDQRRSARRAVSSTPTRPTTAKDRAYAARAGRRDFSDLPF